MAFGFLIFVININIYSKVNEFIEKALQMNN